MVRAAFGGVYDFARFDPRDVRHLFALSLALDEIERRDRVAVERDVLTELTMMIAAGNLADEAGARDARKETRRELMRLCFPWEHRSTKLADVDQLRAAWIAEWGDPNSPETIAAIAATVASLQAARVRR